MNIKSISLIFGAGFLFTTGCSSTYRVNQGNIHKMPLFGTVFVDEGFAGYTLFFKNEGVLNKISSIQWGEIEIPFSTSFDNEDFMMTSSLVVVNDESPPLVKVIVTPDHSPFVRVRSVEIPLELIHDTFLNNTNLSSFLEGNKFSPFEAVQ